MIQDNTLLTIEC